MKDAALLVIDMQAGSFDAPEPVVDGPELMQVVADLIARARKANVPVIYLQNDGPEGALDEPECPGWEIHPAVAPADDEPLIGKRTPDAFQDTDLEAELSELGIRGLVICGLETELSIDTTVRRAFSLGYEVVLVENGHSTRDGSILEAHQIVDHHNSVLGSRFAQCLPSNEIVF